MSSDILRQFTYNGDSVRTTVIDGAPWFVATDVARILGYADATHLTRRLDPDEKGLRSLETLGGVQQLGIINEPGLYVAVLGSKVPGAQAFKRWVTHTVLPEIRETGSYSAFDPNSLTSIEQLVTAAQGAIEAAKEARAQVAELAPRAESWDTLAAADGSLEVADAAKILTRDGIDTGRQRLFTQLEGIHWTYRGPDHRWRAYQYPVEAGYLRLRPQFHYHPATGEKVLDTPQIRVTIKGLDALRRRLNGARLEAVA